MSTPGIDGAQFSGFCDPVAGHGVGGRQVAAFIASHTMSEGQSSKAIWHYDPSTIVPLQLIAQAGAPLLTNRALCTALSNPSALLMAVAPRSSRASPRRVHLFPIPTDACVR
jgi:hypothetical protein